jgi:hypothetical protein
VAERSVHHEPVLELLVKAAAGRFAAPGRKEWTIGWSVETYRRSDRAAVDTKEGPIAFDPPSLEAFERAVESLLREPRVRETWEADDFWGIVANMIATMPASLSAAQLEKRITVRLKQLRRPGHALVALAIANVTWEGPPLTFADVVIGELGDSWKEAVNATARSRPKLEGAETEGWLAVQGGNVSSSGGRRDEDKIEQGEEPSEDSMDVWPDRSASRRPPIVMAIWLRSHFGLATRQARERLQEVIDLAVLLESEPEHVRLFPGGGSANQPGLRGLRLDRGAIGVALANDPAGTREVAGIILHSSQMATFTTIEWYGLEPLPLHALLRSPNCQQRIGKLLQARSPFASRLRTAGRWYAQAHWEDNVIDTILALGIALDALVGDPNGLPLAATSERFALLDPNPETRRARAQTFRDFYGTRSAIAHGGSTKKLNQADYVARMAGEVRWATQRMLLLDDIFSPTTHDDLRKVFDGLKWGSLHWPLDRGDTTAPLM